MTTVLRRLKLRRGTASEWGSANPVLGLGEPGYDSTSGLFKIGDGTNTWSVLRQLSFQLVPTGIAATDTANLLAAISALPAAGGEIRLAAGTFVVTGGSVVFTKPVRLVGAGPSSGPPTTSEISGGITPTNRTTIQCASGSTAALTLQADGCQVEDLTVVCTSGTTPTAGSCGIAVTAKGSGNRYHNVTVRGFYRNWDISTGHEWYMDKCLSYDFVSTGLRINNTDTPDGGDMGVTNCQFIAGPVNNAQSGVEWCSGGGLRFVGNKINKRGSGTFTLGLWLHPNDGISTSVFPITGNSFENMNYGIYADDTGNTGSGVISKLAITGNEFLCSTKVLAFARTLTGKLSDATIVGNVLTGTGTTSGISLVRCDNVALAGNVWKTITTYLSGFTSVTNLMLDGSIPFTTAGRPAATIMAAGSRYYDTTLGQPVWSNGTAWRDAAGNAV